MTERLGEIEERIGSVRQLEAVVTAMRGIAASRSREARNHLDGIRAYAGTIGNAIGEALSLLPDWHAPADGQTDAGGLIVIVLCSEQGFVGAFNDRLLDAAGRHLTQTAARKTELLVVGDRGVMVAEERGLPVDWSAPMVAHADEVTALANRLADTVYRRLIAGATGVTIVHTAPSEHGEIDIVDRTLAPLDLGRFPIPNLSNPPLVTQDPADLLPQLTGEYMFAQLCEAITLSFAAENEARMYTMVAARDNVHNKLDELNALYRRMRQTEITNEIIELAAGAVSELSASR